MTLDDVRWEIETADDGTLTADALRGGEMPSVVRGSTEPFEFLFETRSPYESLVDYLDYAGAAATFESVDLTPYYRTVRPGHDPLVGLNPVGADVDASTVGVWGVITGGRDTSISVADDLFSVRLDVFVLAEYDDFANRAAVKNAHKT